MRPFAVLKQIGDFDAKVVRAFDSKDDAVAFATLLKKTEESQSIKYYLASNVVEVTEGFEADASI